MNNPPEKLIKQKLVANIWITLIDAMSQKIEAQCLLRDSFLDRIFSSEVVYLRKEIKQSNSDVHRALIERGLSKLPRKPVSFSLRQETVSAINETCGELNIPRDAFLNRIFLLLLISDPRKWDTFLGLNDYLGRVHDYVGGGGMSFLGITGLPLVDLGEAMVDPFWGPRRVLEDLKRSQTLSTIEVNSALFDGNLSQDVKNGLAGLNCCVDDTEVDSEPLENRSLDDLLG